MGVCVDAEQAFFVTFAGKKEEKKKFEFRFKCMQKGEKKTKVI